MQDGMLHKEKMAELCNLHTWATMRGKRQKSWYDYNTYKSKQKDGALDGRQNERGK